MKLEVQLPKREAAFAPHFSGIYPEMVGKNTDVLLQSLLWNIFIIYAEPCQSCNCIYIFLF